MPFCSAVGGDIPQFPRIDGRSSVEHRHPRPQVWILLIRLLLHAGHLPVRWCEQLQRVERFGDVEGLNEETGHGFACAPPCHLWMHARHWALPG